MGRLGVVWGRLGTVLGRPGAVSGRLGAVLGHLGAVLGPSWSQLLAAGCWLLLVWDGLVGTREA